MTWRGLTLTVRRRVSLHPHYNWTQSLYLFLVALTLTIDLEAVTALPSSMNQANQLHNLSTDLVSNASTLKISNDETSHIVIKVMFSESSLTEFPLTTVQDVDDLQRALPTFPSEIEAVIEMPDKHSITLYLKRNSLLVTKNFVSKYFTSSGKPVVQKAGEKELQTSYCLFTGKVLSTTDSLVSLNLCNGVNGVVEIADRRFIITHLREGSKVIHKWTESLDDSDEIGTCGTMEFESQNYTTHRHQNRFSREIRLPAGHTTSTRYIELYLVMDHAIYLRHNSVDATVMRAINMVNYASALYQQLDIYLALVGVEVWNDRDKVTYTLNEGSTDRYNPDLLLSEFNKYRMYKISPETPNDSGQLFSGKLFNSGTIGKGSTNLICTQSNSGGVTLDDDQKDYVRPATTMAHELGHNLGMQHSDNADLGENCACEYPGDEDFKTCIMYSSSNRYKQPTKWSPCTKEQLEKDFAANRDHCLKNKPEVLQKVGSTPVCGNFFVEEGEECDCGQPADCESKCCDATSCKLLSNATCATGSCCDIDTCTVRAKSYPCRPLLDSECDLPEFCDGESEWCPADTYKRDGTECNNRGEGYCYDGKCNTHNSQCHFIWGVDSAKNSEDYCYEELNGKARYFGNCGWSSDHSDQTSSHLSRDFHTCDTDADKYCGQLQCQYSYDKSPDERRPSILNYPLSIYYWTLGTTLCSTTAFDVGYKAYDPGQVPNGAKCGNSSMCVNSKCVPVPQAPESCNCNGHGACNQNGECHCDIGWAPPNCNKKGFGGSESSNPSAYEELDLKLVAGLIAFFCGIVPIAVTIAIVSYCRRKDLKKVFSGLSSRTQSKSPGTIQQKQPRLEIQVSTVEETEQPQLNTSRPTPPVFNYNNRSNGGSITNKTAISAPVLQSTTNQHPQFGQGVTNGHVKGPTRAAPPPPNIPNNSTQKLRAVYENVNPPTPPKPNKPPTAPKPALKPKPQQHW